MIAVKVVQIGKGSPTVAVYNNLASIFQLLNAAIATL